MKAFDTFSVYGNRSCATGKFLYDPDAVTEPVPWSDSDNFVKYQKITAQDKFDDMYMGKSLGRGYLGGVVKFWWKALGWVKNFGWGLFTNTVLVVWIKELTQFDATYTWLMTEFYTKRTLAIGLFGFAQEYAMDDVTNGILVARTLMSACIGALCSIAGF